MAVPGFQLFMLPMLELASDGREHTLAEARGYIADRFGLSEEDRSELLPSGRQHRLDNRAAWAKVYLEQAGLLASEKRGHFHITACGQQVIAGKPKMLDIAYLERFDAFRTFRNVSRRQPSSIEAGHEEPSTLLATPEELLEQTYQTIRSELASELLQKVKEASPYFFENLVVELLLKMGYGSSRAEAGRAIGRSGDEGIDGIINEDRLGLDTIYIQAKRWNGTVGRPEIQKFVGALHGNRARKGVFITTSSFSADAREYVSHIDPRVVLIDGPSLAEYMFDLGLGVTEKVTYQVKRVDSDYFIEE